MTEEHWRWKLRGRPSVVDNVGIAVASDDTPIAQFGGIPCPARILGATREVMVGVDVMTAPAYRRQGVFTATASSALERWRAAGVALVLGLANDRWRGRADALGYERVFPLRRLVRILRPDRVLARRLGFRLRVPGWSWNRRTQGEPTDASLEIRALTEPIPALDALWERASGEVAISLVRDRAWVAWRYFSSPVHPYQVTLAERAGTPVGYAAYAVVRGPKGTFVAVPEVFAPTDSQAFAALVRDVVARARAEDADTVVTLAVPGTPSAHALRQAGFWFTSHGWWLEVNRLDSAIPASALRDRRAWSVCGGDFDVI